MASSLGGTVIRPGDRGYQGSRESFYAIQQVLDATDETVSRYGAGSRRRSLRFILFENDNGGVGISDLETDVETDANVALIINDVAQGNFRILRFTFEQILDTANTLSVYECAAELIKV